MAVGQLFDAFGARPDGFDTFAFQDGTQQVIGVDVVVGGGEGVPFNLAFEVKVLWSCEVNGWWWW